MSRRIVTLAALAAGSLLALRSYLLPEATGRASTVHESAHSATILSRARVESGRPPPKAAHTSTANLRLRRHTHRHRPILHHRHSSSCSATWEEAVHRHWRHPGQGRKEPATCRAQRTRTPDTPPTQPERVRVPRRFKPAAADGTDQPASLFAGQQTDEERSAALHGCAGGGALRLLAPNSLNRGSRGAPHGCKVVVLTAILGGLDTLRQPRAELGDSKGCLFAFTDGVVKKSAQDGAWTCCRCWASFRLARTRDATRACLLLPHRLFPKAEYALWIDGKLYQHAATHRRRRFLTEPAADFAALRNLRRDAIDQSTVDHRHALQGQGKEACAVQAQWQLYLGEANGLAPASSGAARHRGRLRRRPPRRRHAVLLCSWFNEYVRYSERDQLSLRTCTRRSARRARQPDTAQAALVRHQVQGHAHMLQCDRKDAQTIATHFSRSVVGHEHLF